MKIMEEKISGIYDGEYFQVVQSIGEVLIVRCMLCQPKEHLIRTSMRSNGNALKHIQRRHPSALKKIKYEKNIRSRPNKKPKLERTEESKQITETYFMGIEEVDEEDDDGPLNEEMISGDFSKAFNSSTIIIKKVPNNKPTNVTVRNGELAKDIVKPEPEVFTFMNNETTGDYHLQFDEDSTNSTADRETIQLTTVNKKPDVSIDSVSDQSSELTKLKKELLVQEFEEIQEMRREKHRFEIEILRRELEFNKIRHRKEIELLNKKLQNKN